MKKTLYIIILFFILCSTIFAQRDEIINTSPVQVDSISYRNNEWHKITVDIVASELLKSPSSTGLIKMRKDNNFWQRIKAFRAGFALRAVDIKRVYILVVDEQKDDIDIFSLSSCSIIPECENCILIRAMDIDKIDSLFRPKTIIKKRKK